MPNNIKNFENWDCLKEWSYGKILYENNLKIYSNDFGKWYYKQNSNNPHRLNENDLHRLDGPAIEYNNGNKEYYVNGQYVPVKSQKEFEKYLKLMAFI